MGGNHSDGLAVTLVFEPGLEAADEIGGSVQAELLELGGGEAGAVALVADDHDVRVVAGDLGNVVVTCRVEPPLEDVAVDHNRARELTVSSSLLDRAGVDDQRALGLYTLQKLGFDSLESSSCRVEDFIDRVPLAP